MARVRMTVQKVKTKGRAFYAELGPYLANRAVAKEIGYHIYDDDQTEWFTCYLGSDLVAFCNCRISAKTVSICSCYTLADHRKKGAMRAIVAAIKAEYAGTLLRVSANTNSKPLFVSEGFKKIRENGAFTVMEFANA